MADPLHILSSSLQEASTGLLVGKGALGTTLSGLSKALGVIDVGDQEIPVLGAITDGLTVATGVGSIIAAAFDKPKAPKEAPVAATASVGEQFGA